MKKIISVILLLAIMLSASSCGEYNPPTTSDPSNTQTPDDNTGTGPEEEIGEPFVATVMLDGKPYTPPTVSDDSLALKVRWSDGKTVYTANVGKDGRAECYGLDGEYAVTLVNLSKSYTYNPNIYSASNDHKSVVIELKTLGRTYGSGADLESCITLSKTGFYRAEIGEAGQVVYFEFTPTRAGIYLIESLMDVSAQMYDPVADVYYGSSQFKTYAYQLDGGGASQGYTTNFRHTIEIDEAFIGNCYTFGIFVKGKDATYPVNVDFEIAYKGEYYYDWIVSDFVYPEFIPNGSSFDSWFDEYKSYLESDRERYGDSSFKIASVRIDGKNVFDEQYFRLNPLDGYYHVFDPEMYSEYGGWGPVLYANITIPTEFLDKSFHEIEYEGNKALTVSSGTENYKLFIEGYASLVREEVSYFCVKDCKCLATNGGACTVEENCTRCTEECRHIKSGYKNQKGYAEIAIDGRCPVTEELKEFLQKYSVNQKLFSDGNGWAEAHNPRYDAYEDSQWLFACGYYTE